MAVIDPPSPLFSLNHFTFQDHTHTHTHRGIKAHTDTYCRNAYTHTHADAPRDLTWTSGHLVKEFNWPPSLSLSLSRSLCLSGCHRTCQALMPSNLLPNTHCRLSFKGPLTGMTNISTPPALLLPSLSLSPSVSPFLTACQTSFSLLLRPSAFLHQSLKLCLWLCRGPILAFVQRLLLLCISFFLWNIIPLSFLHFTVPFFFSSSFFPISAPLLLKSNLMPPFSAVCVWLVLPPYSPTVSSPL